MTVMLAVPPLSVTDEQRRELERIARASSMPHRTVVQAKALLLSADGAAIYEVARELKVSSNSVRRWRRRFQDEGLDRLGRIAPGRGRKSWLPEGTVAEVVRVTLEELPTTAPPTGPPASWPSGSASARTPWPASGSATP